MSVRAAVKKYGIVGDATGDLTRKVLSCPVFDLQEVFPSVEKQCYLLGKASNGARMLDIMPGEPGPAPFPVCVFELGILEGETVDVINARARYAILENCNDEFFVLCAIAGLQVFCCNPSDYENPGMITNTNQVLEWLARKVINDRKRVSVTLVDQPRRKSKTRGERLDVVYHVVKLKAGRTPERYGKLLARAERMAPRWHEVRGHWKYNGTKWIDSYDRGRGGIVEKDYRVE